MKPLLPSSTFQAYATRILGSGLILALLIWLLPMDAFLEALGKLTLRHFVLVLTAFLLLHVLAAIKWWILLDFRLSPMLALRAHFAGLAGNLFLPGAIGGDAVRGGMAYASMGDGSTVVAAGAADRFIDLLALLILALLGLSLSVTYGGSLKLTLDVLAVFAGLSSAAILALVLLPRVWSHAPWLPGQSIATKLTGAFANLAKRRSHVAAALAMSLGIQYGLLFIAGKLARAAGADVEPGHWLFAWPLAKVVAVLPVSLNGLGVREAALASILAPIAPATTSSSEIVAAGLVWQVVLFAAGGIGALIVLITPQARQALKAKSTPM